MSAEPARGADGPGGLARAYIRRRYAILFYSLLFALAAGPVSAALRLGGGLESATWCRTPVAASAA